MPSAGFEPAITASERPQAHTLDHAAPLSSLQRASRIKLLTGVLSVYHVEREWMQGCSYEGGGDGTGGRMVRPPRTAKLGGKMNTLNANNFSTLKVLNY